MKKKLKFIIPVLVIALIASLAISLAACKKTDSPTTDNNSLSVKDTALSTMANSALLLGQMPASNGLVANNGMTAGSSAEADQATMDKVGSYMALVESYLGKVPQYEKKETVDKEGYSDQYTITSGDIKMNIYLNIVLKGTKTEYDLDDAGKQEVEEEFTVDGLLVYGEGENAVEYEVTGSYVKETEDDEVEKVLTLESKDKNDNRIRVVVKQEEETEDDGSKEIEQFFLYNVYSKTGLVSSVKIKSEVEDNVSKVKVFTKDGQGKPVFAKVEKVKEGNVTYYKGMIMDEKTGATRKFFKIEMNADGTYSYMFKEKENGQYGGKNKMQNNFGDCQNNSQGA